MGTFFELGKDAAVKGEGDGLRLHQLCTRYSGTLTPTAPMSIMIWETLTFFNHVLQGIIGKQNKSTNLRTCEHICSFQPKKPTFVPVNINTITKSGNMFPIANLIQFVSYTEAQFGLIYE